MNQNMKVIEKLIYSYNKMNDRSKNPKDYGTGHVLYQSEIHAIQAIKNHSQANASELAKVLGITNGAVTQIIGKLITKGLANKFYLSDNKKEVYFKLTPQGELAFEGHEKHHLEMNSKVLTYLEGLDHNDVEVINNFFDKLNEFEL